MEDWKCEECNMKFETRTLYETHKKKFCGILGDPPGATPVEMGARKSGYGNRLHAGSKTSNRKLSPTSIIDMYGHSARSPRLASPEDQRMSKLEKEKVEELKALKASMSLERAAHRGRRDSPIESHVDSYRGMGSRGASQIGRTSRELYSSGDKEMFEDRLKELHRNHQEQLEQLREQNKRLQGEKIVVQKRMKSLNLKSREKLVSQGSVDKHTAELEGLKQYLDYKKSELSNDYDVEMSKLNALKKKSNQSFKIISPETPPRRIQSPEQESKSQLVLYSPSRQALPLPPQVSQTTLGIPSNQYLPIQTSQTGVLAELNALRSSYLQGGGNDPVVLSQIRQLEMDAQQVQASQRPAIDPILQQQIMSYHLSNQRLEQELQLLRAERQGSSGQSKTPDLSPEFRHLKTEHLEKMTALRQEGEMLKQQTEIEKMKKELQELRGDKTTPINDKQTYETPFIMSSSGMEKTLLPSPYDPSAGFSVFWDFILGMSSTYTKCRLAVGIYNGTDLISDVKVLPTTPVSLLKTHQHPTIPSGGAAILGAMHPFPKCAPLPILSLVVELQANSTGDAEDPRKLYSRGWTKMDLFDASDRLISGRWRIPFRVPPIKTYLNTYELNRIPQAGLAELYIRLVNTRDVRSEEALSPQPLQHYLYKFPPMENPAVYRFDGQQPPSRTVTAATTIHPPVPPPSVQPPPDTPGGVSVASVRSNRTPGDPSLLGFQIDKLYNAIDGEVKVKITAYNQQDGEVVKAMGDTPVTCVTKAVRQDFLQDIYSFGLQEALYRHVQWNTHSIVVLRVYLQPTSSAGSTNHSASNLLDESKLAAWTLVPLTIGGEPPIQRQSRQSQGRSISSRSQSQLNIGTFKLPLFFPPVPDVKDMTSLQVKDYPESWSRYGRAYIRFTIFSGVSRAPDRPLSPAEFINENDTPKNAWIKHGRQSLASEPFDAGSGFDLYIDGARYLPDSITFTKVAGRVLDRNYQKVGPDIDVQAHLDSDIYNPDYDCRLEFREPLFPATSTLMVKLYTVERVTKRLCCVGYAVLPIFLELGTTKQPTNDSTDEKVSLNDGSHQLRIYNGAPDFSQPLSESIVESLSPVPCASLLVRITGAACYPNGRPKETSQFPESEWESEGLVIPRKPYEEGQYYSLSCEPSLGESQMLNSMVKRQPISVKESIKFTGDGQEQNMRKDQVITSWIKTQLTRSLDSTPGDFDLNYVALYHPLHGLKVSVDAAQNLPWTHFTFATYCLSPPGAFYKGDREDPLELSTRLLHSSDINSPSWIDDFKSLPCRTYQRFLVLIIHLHEVTVDYTQNQEVWGLKGQGWTALQVFHDGYVLNGCYQLPLYNGEPSEAMLKALQTDVCQDVMANFRRKKTVKYLEGASVFVRLSDARRVEELPQPQANIRHDYLPRDKLDKYTTVNPSRPISTLVPSGISEPEFTDVLAHKFQEMLKQIFGKHQKSNAPKSK